MRRLVDVAAIGTIGPLPPVENLLKTANDWIAGDPDHTTRLELQEIITEGDMEELASRFEGTLTFGTAGIRGEVGAGPARMNRAVIIRTTKGLADYLTTRESGVPEGPVVIGFDARPTSRQFAEDAAAVLLAAGFSVKFFPEVAPTPLVAFAAKHLGACAAVVVTASHNPPADNGYKVYDANAAQIVSPVDQDIARSIALAPKASSVPMVASAFDQTHERISTIGGEMFDAYWAEVDAVRPQATPSDLKIVYTPIHGVGGLYLEEAFKRGGHTGLISVPGQSKPDGTFPTVSFPNPEEPGALDLAMELATEVSADLVIANDPDADRLAAVIQAGDNWRPLSGNEIGVLLGDYILRHYRGSQRPMVFNSIVSSPMLARIAAHYSAYHEVTLTGFKWIVNAGLELESRGVGKFAFGYEEALGYTVGPVVRDKDGISAALVFADLTAGLRAERSTIVDRLAQLWSEHGLWVSAQHSVVKKGQSGADSIQRAVDGLGAEPPGEVGGMSVTDVVDYRQGEDSRPHWLGAQALIQLELGNVGRVLVRPSGTEPKLKVYVDLSGEPGLDASAARQSLTDEAERLAAEVAESLRFD